MSVLSPRTRTLSDSMDDDELSELHDRRQQTSFGIDNRQFPRCSTPSESAFLKLETEPTAPVPYQDVKVEQVEDTDDLSEGEDPRQDESPQEIKEQIYHDKLAFLKTSLAELEAGNHTEFKKMVGKIDNAFVTRMRLNEACRDYEIERIEAEYNSERLMAAREFEEKKIELRESLMSELEEKKKQIEMERFTMELTSDPTEFKPMSTRKLRRRPNEPLPMPEKRRKVTQSQISFRLDDKAIDEDLKSIALLQNYDAPVQKPKTAKASATSSIHIPPIPIHFDARIEDGKLFYEKRWYHRGQPVFVEGKDLARTSGVISGISQDLVWVRKLNEQSKVKVTIPALQKGKMIIKRRA